jgi:hypothetical protein
MKGAACPWCGADALGFWERQTVGLLPRKCHNCAKQVRASGPSLALSITLVLVPFVAAIVYGDRSQLGDLAALLVAGAGLAAGGGLAMAWNQRYGRLVRHESGSPQAG